MENSILCNWYSHPTIRTQVRGRVTLRDGLAIPSDAFWSRIQRDQRRDTTPGYVRIDGDLVQITDPHPQGY